MSAELYLDLSWLPRPAADFNKRCSLLASAGAEAGARARELASTFLDENRLNRLARVIRELQAKGQSLAPLIPLKLAIVSNATTDFMEPAFIATAARYGFALTVKSAPYGQVMQAAMDPSSFFGEFQPDLVFCALDYRGLPLVLRPGDAEAANGSVAAALDQITAVRKGFQQALGAVCIVQTLARPPETLFGSFDARLPGSWRTLIDAFNRGLVQAIEGSPDLLLDTAGLAETVGLGLWHDPLLWNLAKAPFSDKALPLFADHFCRLISAWRGKSRKCLVLDLDNTLWGGVIGDDGVDNILLAEGDATGEAHLEVQRTAIRLRERGIVLAVSSKNDDEVARTPFRDHAEMLLRENHFAVFQANWRDKATNISAIAEELALGIDSLVFLDDNPVERNLVRSRLPSVGVPELPDDPALFARTLIASGLFEAIAYSAEDSRRADDYQSNARRLALQANAGNIDDYLQSLAMRMRVQPFDAQGRTRISQLINKSNQFNLTTQRYSEAEVAAVESDPSKFAIQIRLEDQFADNGMICVVICSRQDDAWLIDTWLMSCRVLGRQVERAVLQTLKRHAERTGVRRLVGEYRPTERNSMVAKHYEKLGFSLLSKQEDETTLWVIPVSDIEMGPIPMTIDDTVPV